MNTVVVVMVNLLLIMLFTFFLHLLLNIQLIQLYCIHLQIICTIYIRFWLVQFYVMPNCWEYSMWKQTTQNTTDFFDDLVFIHSNQKSIKSKYRFHQQPRHIFTTKYGNKYILWLKILKHIYSSPQIFIYTRSIISPFIYSSILYTCFRCGLF